jgi:hypothetical protein
MIYPKHGRAKSRAYLDAACGQECTLQIPGICVCDPAQSQAAHLRLFSMTGVGHKPHDFLTVDACTPCHRILDKRDLWEQAGLQWRHVLQALMITLDRRYQAGLITLKGSRK